MTEGLASRRAALSALRRVDEDAAYSNLVVPEEVAVLGDQRERAFASHLAYDALRWQGTLDWMLGQVVDRPLAKVEPELLRILRLGALQLFRTEVPAHAAVKTAADLAREAVPGGRGRGAAGFVNGVLRGLSRQVGDLGWPDPDANLVEHLALTTAHPAWEVAYLLDRFGPERTTTILHADNEPPGLTLRAVGDRAALLAELEEEGVDAYPGAAAPEAVRVPGADPRRLAAVEQGRAVPQDEASMLVVHATGVQHGDAALDLCAGPGGKATHLAQLGAQVTAVELNPRRARLVEEAAERIGVEVEVRVGDGTAPPVEGPFDVVLVDAPCTGLGTGRRRPEVRWRRTPHDAAALSTLQRQLLAAAVPLLRPGGRLTYSVCTWTGAETIDVARSAESARALQVEEERQLLPDTDGTDGMFYVSWRVHDA
ncbi:MAG: transcription antitermination factor NusB [Nitriliruptorales bacterium]|nr:transcription antitermination factor NusB [Nitriliruptorales bacterium]